ncbi:hypothetical protein JW756_04255 [Candidatus Woesearchaeota archaeon]|nr:hypothetical protein [Candidatus Woesearchaeota archaeon]
MDFDKFIEKDILEFLDKQAMNIAEKAAGLREEEFDLYEINKDYSKEIDSALKEGDLGKAQKIFEDVKNHYIKAPPTSLSKKRLYTIMEEMYEKIKDFESKEEGKKNLFDTIREYENKGLFKTPGLTAEDREASIANIDLLMSSITTKEKELEETINKKPASKESIQQAVSQYRELKSLIKKIPEAYKKEKSEAYDSALSIYYTIKKLKESMREEQEKKITAQVSEEKNIEEEKIIEQRLAEIRTLKEEIIKSHDQIAELIKKNDIQNSVSEYKRLKTLLEQFPHEMEAEKTALLADALALYESIKKLKQKAKEATEQENIMLQEKQKEEDSREKIRQDLNNRMNNIKGLLKQKDALGAISAYKELKKVFANYPEQPAEEKKQLYEDILSAHKDIKLLEDDLRKKAASVYKDKIADIDKVLQEAQQFLEKGENEESTHRILEAKHRIQLLPNEAFDEKYRLLKAVEVLEHKIMFVKNVQKINAQMTVN